MDITDFLCISLDSSTVQLQGSLGNRRACSCSETGFCSQNGNRRTAFCCAFLCGQKRLNAKDIHKEILPDYGVKCLLLKGVAAVPIA
jgi:hypothetical protein